MQPRSASSALCCGTCCSGALVRWFLAGCRCSLADVFPVAQGRRRSALSGCQGGLRTATSTTVAVHDRRLHAARARRIGRKQGKCRVGPDEVQVQLYERRAAELGPGRGRGQAKTSKGGWSKEVSFKIMIKLHADLRPAPLTAQASRLLWLWYWLGRERAGLAQGKESAPSTARLTNNGQRIPTAAAFARCRASVHLDAAAPTATAASRNTSRAVNQSTSDKTRQDKTRQSELLLALVCLSINL
jgi:hypothetical protein